MKRLLVILGISATMFGIGMSYHNRDYIKTELHRYEIKQELKSTYSEYNMLLKNKKHGAPIPQDRLDKLQLKARMLKIVLQDI
ncbi:MAG: hypothetical protein ACRCX2_24045 [Paraclostridium sp.]